MLDYVGHAAVTDRLLAVDPGWTWEPMATDENGLPALDKAGNLWIRLTVCGVTRIGVGDGRSAKEIVGDALRNAAMRFGVALDLWSKEELEHSDDGPGPASDSPQPKPAGDLRTDAQSKKLAIELKEAGLTEREKAHQYVVRVIGRPIESTKELTKAEASMVIEELVAAKKKAADPVTGEIAAANVDPWEQR
jgi:hypothetical protein